VPQQRIHQFGLLVRPDRASAQRIAALHGTGRLLLWAPGRGWARTTDGLWQLEGEG
jgi:hypothetical protein